jgi:hypothetical protein
MSLAPIPRGDAILFALVPTKIKYLVLAPIAHRRGLNASPPFSGGSPQAMLRLWLI